MGGGQRREEGMFARLFLVNLQQHIIQASGGNSGPRIDRDNSVLH